MLFKSNHIFFRILLIHIFIILILFIFSGLKGCFKSKNTNEITTFVEFHSSEYTAAKEIEQGSESEENVENQSISKKPKWTPTPVNQIKKGKVVNVSQPNISNNQNEIKNVIRNLDSFNNTSDDNATYLNLVQSFLFNKWNPPSPQGFIKSPIIKLFIDKQGKILKRVNIVLSQDSSYNESVLSLVGSLDYLPKPPNNYKYNYVEITFSPENN